MSYLWLTLGPRHVRPTAQSDRFVRAVCANLVKEILERNPARPHPYNATAHHPVLSLFLVLSSLSPLRLGFQAAGLPNSGCHPFTLACQRSTRRVIPSCTSMPVVARVQIRETPRACSLPLPAHRPPPLWGVPLFSIGSTTMPPVVTVRLPDGSPCVE
jgi:hypothetical protein